MATLRLHADRGPDRLRHLYHPQNTRNGAAALDEVPGCGAGHGAGVGLTAQAVSSGASAVSTSLMKASVKAGISAGWRLVTRLPSVATSLSITSAPAFLRSVRIEGQLVTVRPRITSASASSHGPWQMAPTGFPASTNRSEEHTSEIQSLIRISFARFCLKK